MNKDLELVRWLSKNFSKYTPTGKWLINEPIEFYNDEEKEPITQYTSTEVLDIYNKKHLWKG